ncbi:SCO2584 family spore wall biosynthesis protein [Streptomyces sp. NPDC003236]
MPEDVGGTPFSDGWEPDDDQDRGVSDEEFAAVVFDEAFVQAAVVHEPTAVERLLAAAQARAEASEAEARRARAGVDRYDDGYGLDGAGFRHDQDDDEFDDDHARGDQHGSFWPYGKQVRWHRPVAWLLALVMGVGMVALAFAAVYRGASSGTRDRMPSPASTGLEQGAAARPSAPAGTARPAVSVIPRSP